MGVHPSVCSSVIAKSKNIGTLSVPRANGRGRKLSSLILPRESVADPAGQRTPPSSIYLSRSPH